MTLTMNNSLFIKLFSNLFNNNIYILHIRRIQKIMTTIDILDANYTNLFVAIVLKTK